MITSLLLTLIYYLLLIICSILPTYQIWPNELLDGLTYFFSQLSNFNFIFPIDSLFSAIVFFVSFEALYLTAKLIMKVFGFARGTGTGLDL